MRAVFALSLLSLWAFPALAQPPGGERGRGFGGERGGGGMRGFSADDSFNRLVQSYGGSGDTLDFALVPPDTRERYNRMASFSGSEPMPASGTISRAQYTEMFNKRMEAFRNAGFGRGGGGFGGDRGGGGFGGGGNMPAPGGQPGVTVTVGGGTGPQPGAMPMQNWRERTLSDDEAARYMRRYDRDGDGRISLQEAQESERIRPLFAHYDANKDGFLDLGEFKTYATDRENNRTPDRMGGGNNAPQQWGGDRGNGGWGGDRGGWGGNGGGWGGGGGDYNRDRTPPPAEEERPVVYRFGKLPKDLPSWFERLDTDKDGQVGLYEWRADKRDTAEFLAMDLNRDGLLTAEEYLRYKKMPMTSPTDSLSAFDSESTPSRANAFREKGKGNLERRDDNRRDSRDDSRRESRGGGNPFRDK